MIQPIDFKRNYMFFITNSGTCSSDESFIGLKFAPTHVDMP